MARAAPVTLPSSEPHATHALADGGTRYQASGAASRPPVSTLNERPTLHYSITWSARARSEGGIVSPRALAVLRLMTRSNLVGCSTGRSAGFVPLRILSTYAAARPYISGRLGP